MGINLLILQVRKVTHFLLRKMRSVIANNIVCLRILPKGSTFRTLIYSEVVPLPLSSYFFLLFSRSFQSRRTNRAGKIISYHLFTLLSMLLRHFGLAYWVKREICPYLYLCSTLWCVIWLKWENNV